MKLKTKLLLTLLILLGAVLSATIASIYFIEKHHLAGQQRQTRRTTIDRFAHVCGDSIINNDELARLNYLKTLLASAEPKSVRSVILATNAGSILMHSDFLSGDLSLMNKPAGEPYLEWLAGARYAEHRFKSQGRSFLASVSPVQPAGRNRLGSLILVYDETATGLLLKRMQGETLRRLLQVGLAGAGVSALVSLVLAGTLTRPIRTLAAGTRKIGQGDFTCRIPAARKDELGDLANEFNSMARKLGELDELKDSFLGKITHDLRNPLTSVIGYAQILMTGALGELSDRQKKPLEIILSGARFLTEMADNILDITKLEAGKMEFKKTDIHVTELFESVKELLQVKADEYKVELGFRLADGMSTVRADKQALYRILTNLVSNALKFTPEGGKISVEAFPDREGGACFAVKDTGIGIAPDKLNALFSKFTQINRDRSPRQVKGTGLGLVIAKDFVEGHGGKIWVTSEPGKGATFTFVLPPA
ncbi:MAG: HAMP domain-containing histidine kinase [Elusimicrobia bacterium]|nr:HAMP domain-containing histidine kinase [Elusimicrobiota bacterium]